VTADLHFILGGARSGKSRYAEMLAHRQSAPVTYIATAEPKDAEMQARIAHHRMQRPDHWQTQEVPIALAEALCAAENSFIIVDCLTLWLLNCMEAQRMEAVGAFLEVLPQLRQPVVLVSNEIGMGVVPADPLSRRFVDELGRLHQQVAAMADRVTLMVAGLSVEVKK